MSNEDHNVETVTQIPTTQVRVYVPTRDRLRMLQLSAVTTGSPEPTYADLIDAAVAAHYPQAEAARA